MQDVCVNKILRLRERLAVSPERERSPRRRHRRRNRHRPRPAWVTNLHTGRPAHQASGRDGGDARRRGAENTSRRETPDDRAARGPRQRRRHAHSCVPDHGREPRSNQHELQAAGPSPWRRACVRTAQHGHPPPLVVVTLEIVTDSPIPPHSRPRQHTPGGPRREYRIRQ